LWRIYKNADTPLARAAFDSHAGVPDVTAFEVALATHFPCAKGRVTEVLQKKNERSIDSFLQMLG
jgi:hypothetical protein